MHYAEVSKQRVALAFDQTKYDPTCKGINFLIFWFILSEVNVTPLFRGLTHKTPWFKANLDQMSPKIQYFSDFEVKLLKKGEGRHKTPSLDLKANYF